jgi:site-specific DNA-methyltransferase (adenine-specific)
VISLHHGDCLEVMPTLPAASVDCVITDPPYNRINRITGGLREIDKGGTDSDPVNIHAVAAEFARLARHSAVVFCSDTQFSEWVNAFNALGMTTRIGVWHKTNPSPMNGEKLYLSALELCVIARKEGAAFNGHCEHPVWTGNSERVWGFPCPKPVWLMEAIIKTVVPVGGIVLDPYLGGGATGVAAVRAGRQFIGIEIRRAYYRLAANRIEVERLRKTQLRMELTV